MSTKYPTFLCYLPQENIQLRQFTTLYNFMANSSFIYLIPSIQDLPYLSIGDVGTIFNKNILISNFTDEKMRPMSLHVANFFNFLNYTITICPFHCNIGHNLLHFKKNIYFGAVRNNDSIKEFTWMENIFNIEIIPILMPNDIRISSIIFPITLGQVIINSKLDIKSKKILEKNADIISLDYTPDLIKIGTQLIGSSNINSLSIKDDNYIYERNKVDAITKICSNYLLEAYFFNIDKLSKTISELFIDLNYAEYIPSIVGEE